MYSKRNMGNFAPGRKLIFQGFRGNRPAVATFCLEKSDDGVFRIVDILHVPVHHRPTTQEGYRRTKRWPRQRALQSMGAA